MLFNGDKLYMFPSAGGGMQVMAFAIAGDGDVICIDSASHSEAEDIERTLLELGGRVKCWFFTHAHLDHIEGFIDILRRGKLQIDEVCYTFPPVEYLRSLEPEERGINVYLDFEAAIKKSGIKVTVPKKGVPMQTGHFKVLPLSDGRAVSERFNATSIVYRVDTRGDSILFLGDMDWTAEEKILCEFEQEIKCPVVQMAHHGQDGVTEKFYKAVQPRVALWCTPPWLWDNDAGGGFNTGPFHTLQTRAWMEKLGVKNYKFEKEITVLE